MFTSYLYPVFRSPFVFTGPFASPYWGSPYYGGGVSSFSGINSVGSAIGVNNLVNTGIATNVSQVASPISIW